MDLQKKLKLKPPFPLKSVAAYLAKCKRSTTQLKSTVDSVKSDAKTFNYSKCLPGCYFFVYTD